MLLGPRGPKLYIWAFGKQMGCVSWVWSLQVHGNIISGELEAPSI